MPGNIEASIAGKEKKWSYIIFQRKYFWQYPKGLDLGNNAVSRKGASKRGVTVTEKNTQIQIALILPRKNIRKHPWSRTFSVWSIFTRCQSGSSYNRALHLTHACRFDVNHQKVKFMFGPAKPDLFFCIKIRGHIRIARSSQNFRLSVPLLPIFNLLYSCLPFL